MSVVRIQNPAAYDLPDVQALIARAFEDHPHVGPEDALSEFRRLAGYERLAVFMGREDGGYKALAVVALPASALMPWPQVYHFYNEGTKSLREDLIASVVDFVRQTGYDAFHAMHARGQEGAFERAFRSAGVPMKSGTHYVFDVQEGQEI